MLTIAYKIVLAILLVLHLFAPKTGKPVSRPAASDVAPGGSVVTPSTGGGNAGPSSKPPGA